MKKKDRQRMKLLNNKQPKINIDPKTLDDVKCAKCGGDNFGPGFSCKFLPLLLSPQNQPMYVATEHHVCLGCGEALPTPVEYAKVQSAKIMGGH